MANQWFRLWHDLPTDAKIKIVSKASELPVHLVMSVYITMLVDASQNMSRGVTKCHDEEIAVTIECDMCQVAKIRDAMQGWLLDGNIIKGWEKRQPKKEDSGSTETGAKSALERKREERERRKQEAKNNDVTQCHAMSRNVTTDKIRVDKIREDIKDISLSNDKEIVDTEVPTIEDGGEKNDKSESFSGEPGKPVGKKPKSPPCPYEKIKELYHNVLPSLPTIQSLSDKRKGHIRNLWRRQLKSLVEWENYFKHVSNSDFLMGKTSQRDRAPFNCTIDFLINENNFLKISEMKYHGNRLQQRK